MAFSSSFFSLYIVVRQNEIGDLSMAKSHITGIEKTDPKQGGQKDLPLASALAKIWTTVRRTTRSWSRPKIRQLDYLR